MANSAVSTGDHSQTKIFFSSGGLTIVALVCALSGFLLAFNQPISAIDRSKILLILFYVALIFPYLYSRYAALEGRTLTPEELSNSARFVPLVLAISLLIIFFLTVLFPIIPAAQRWNLVSAELVALCPFAYLGIRMYQRVEGNGSRAIQERQFKNKILIPAFAICLISFAFGWTLVSPNFPYLSIAIPGLLIVAGREFLDGRSWPWAVAFISAIILFAAGAEILGSSAVGNVVLLATILTLAMGVAEICRRVVRINQGASGFAVPVPPEDANFYLAGANWASAIFPLFLLLLPLLIPRLPVLPIFLIVAVQYLHWHFLAGDKKNNWIAATNIILAFSPPLLIAVYYLAQIPYTPSVVSRIPLDPLLAVAIAYVGFYLAVLFFWSPDIVRLFRKSLSSRDAYLSESNCFVLFLFALLVAFGLAALVALINDTGSQYFQPKAKETILALLALCVLATISRWLKNRIGRSSSNAPIEPNNASEHKGNTLRSAAVLVMSVARAHFALVAGLPVFVLLLRHGGTSIVDALLKCVPIVATTMAGFVLNDIFDVDGDRNSARYKALAQHHVSMISARYFAMGAIAVAVLSAVLTAPNNAMLVIFAALIGVVIYSPLARVAPVSKGFVTAILACSPIMYAAELANFSVPYSYYVALFAFVFGREFLLDVQDYPRDQLVGMTTLAAHVGLRRARVVGWSCMFAGMLFLALGANGLPLYLYLAGLSVLIAGITAYRKSETSGLVWSRYAFLMTAIGASLAI